MKPEQISDALNFLDDELIQETEQLRNSHKRPNKTYWKEFRMIAACLALFMIGSLYFNNFLEQPVDPITPTETENFRDATEDEIDTPSSGTLSSPKLPMLILSGLFGNLGSGFDEIIYDDIAKFVAMSPWEENLTPEEMPVFENKYYTADFVPYGFSKEEMEETLKQIVSGLGTELLNSNYTEATQYVSAYLTATTTLAEIQIDGAGNVTIRFLPLELPEKYRVREDTPDDVALDSINYLIERFSGLFGYSETIVEIYPQYDYLGRSQRRYTVYEGRSDLADSEDVTGALLKRRYLASEFTFSEQGELESIRIKHGLSCAEQLEDYPVITTKEACQLLLNGKYFSQGSVSFRVSEERIAAVELVYLPSNHLETIIPYYCFYVEDPDASFSESADPKLIENLKIYRKCYVPAVEEEYIKNMPVSGIQSD